MLAIWVAVAAVAAAVVFFPALDIGQVVAEFHFCCRELPTASEAFDHHHSACSLVGLIWLASALIQTGYVQFKYNASLEIRRCPP